MQVFFLLSQSWRLHPSVAQSHWTDTWRTDQGMPRVGNFMPFRERRKLEFALPEGCCYRTVKATNTKNCIMIYLRFSLTFPEFRWESRGRSVAAGVGIPHCFWKHLEMKTCGAIGNSSLEPDMDFFILFFL